MPPPGVVGLIGINSMATSNPAAERLLPRRARHENRACRTIQEISEGCPVSFKRQDQYQELSTASAVFHTQHIHSADASFSLEFRSLFRSMNSTVGETSGVGDKATKDRQTRRPSPGSGSTSGGVGSREKPRSKAPLADGGGRPGGRDCKRRCFPGLSKARCLRVTLSVIASEQQTR